MTQLIYNQPNCPKCGGIQLAALLKVKVKPKTFKARPDYLKAVADGTAPLAAKIAPWLKKEGQRIAAIIAPAANKIDLCALLRKAAPKSIASIIDGLDLADWSVLAGIVTEDTYKVYQHAYEDGLNVSGITDVDTTNQASEAAQNYAQDRAAELVGKVINDAGKIVDNPNAVWSITESTRNILKSLVQKAIDEGDSTAMLAKKIESSAAFSDTRAVTIARTELATSYIQGNLSAWVSAGVEGKQSVLGSEHDIDDECDQAAADGVIAIGEDFSNGFLAPPYHPDCVCDILPIIHMDKMAKGFDPSEARDDHGRWTATAGGKTEYEAHTTTMSNKVFIEARAKAHAHANYLKSIGHTDVKVTKRSATITMPGKGIGTSITYTVHHGQPPGIITEDTSKSINLISLLKYDPSEARDNHGMWTTGGDLSTKANAARLKALRVPPAWTDVKLNKDPNAALQAIGRDSKGRPQYLYSAAHSEEAAAEKFARLNDFHKAESKITGKAFKDMANKALPTAERDTAASLALISKTGFRVGSDRSTGAEVKAFGASNLLGSHVTVKGDTLTFNFTGKKGVNQLHSLTDKSLAQYISERKAAVGGGRLFKTDDNAIRDYMHASGGAGFKVKDYRTYVATKEALKAVDSMPAPTTASGYKKARNVVGDIVSSKLGNSRTMALNSYIHPAVFAKWGFK